MEASRGAGARDVGWLAFAVVALAFTALAVLALVAAIVTVRWAGIVEAPLLVLAGFWFTAGAWRRTSWGRPAPGTGPPDPPDLTPARARQATVMALGCAIAAAVALGVQVVQARS